MLRASISLLVNSGMSPDQIAQSLGVDVDTVRTLI